METGPSRFWSTVAEIRRAVLVSRAAGSGVGDGAGLCVCRAFCAPSCPTLSLLSACSSNIRTVWAKTTRGSLDGRGGQTHLSLISRAWEETVKATLRMDTSWSSGLQTRSLLQTRTTLHKKICAVHVLILFLCFPSGPCVVFVCSVLQQEISHLFVLLCDKIFHQNAAVN